jgi:hypothetical protein
VSKKGIPCVFSQELRLGTLPSLLKVVGSDLTAGPNAVESGCQARPKTLPKNINSVGSGSKHFKGTGSDNLDCVHSLLGFFKTRGSGHRYIALWTTL